MNKIRRNSDSTIQAFLMDPERRAIYVEGSDDRYFLEYVLGEDITKSQVIEINDIDLGDVRIGGQKGRLLYFASKAEKMTNNIKVFVDADFSRLLTEKVSNNVIFTDYRDLEAYLYEKDYLTKFIKLGIKKDCFNADNLLSELYKAREIAYLRITSCINDYNLAFQKTNERFSKYYSLKNGLDIEKYLNVLLQNSDNRPDLNDLKRNIILTKEKFISVSDREIIHGKDAICIVKEISHYLGLKKDNIESVFWMSFNKDNIERYYSLVKIKNFLSKN